MEELFDQSTFSKDYIYITPLGSKPQKSTVSQIQHKMNEEQFALKAVQLGVMEHAARSQEVIEKKIANAVKECETMQKLQHPNILQQYEHRVKKWDTGRWWKKPVYIQIRTHLAEDCTTLTSQIESMKKPYTEKQMWKFLVETVSTMRFVQANGIVHRDLKPNNILINKEGHYLIADFCGPRELRHTEELSSYVGHQLYTAPEFALTKTKLSGQQDAGAKKIKYSKKVDTYSLGAILYEMVTLKKLKDNEDYAGLRGSLANDEARKYDGDFLDFLEEHYSRILIDLIEWMVRKDYSQRPTFSEVWRVIRARYPFSEDNEDADYAMIDYYDKLGEVVDGTPQDHEEITLQIPDKDRGLRASRKAVARHKSEAIKKVNIRDDSDDENIDDPETPQRQAQEANKFLTPNNQRNQRGRSQGRREADDMLGSTGQSKRSKSAYRTPIGDQQDDSELFQNLDRNSVAVNKKSSMKKDHKYLNPRGDENINVEPTAHQSRKFKTEAQSSTKKKPQFADEEMGAFDQEESTARKLMNQNGRTSSAQKEKGLGTDKPLESVEIDQNTQWSDDEIIASDKCCDVRCCKMKCCKFKCARFRCMRCKMNCKALACCKGFSASCPRGCCPFLCPKDNCCPQCPGCGSFCKVLWCCGCFDPVTCDNFWSCKGCSTKFGCGKVCHDIFCCGCMNCEGPSCFDSCDTKLGCWKCRQACCPSDTSCYDLCCAPGPGMCDDCKCKCCKSLCELVNWKGFCCWTIILIFIPLLLYLLGLLFQAIDNRQTSYGESATSDAITASVFFSNYFYSLPYVPPFTDQLQGQNLTTFAMRADLPPFEYEPLPPNFWKSPSGASIPRAREDIEFTDSSIYDGEFVGGLKDGRGILLEWDPSGFSYYEGFWANGIRQGRGRTVWPQHTDQDLGGWVHEGQYENDVRNGNGQLAYKNGDLYKGMFKDDKAHGQGVYTWADTSVYEGNFDNNQRTGQGKYTWASGRFYAGEWYNDMRHGTGMQVFKNGQMCKVQYFQGKLQDAYNCKPYDPAR